MAVFCDSISVIVRRDSVDKHYKGGWNQFVIDFERNPMCCDSELVSISFTMPKDAEDYVDKLRKKGLQFYQTLDNPDLPHRINVIRKNYQSKRDLSAIHSIPPRIVDDLVVIDSGNRLRFHNEEADWIELGYKKFNDKQYSFCWLRGSTTDVLATPAGCDLLNFDIRIIERMPRWVDSLDFKRFKHVRTENDLDIYTDPILKYEFFLPHGMSFDDYYAYFRRVDGKQSAREKRRLEIKISDQRKAQERKQVIKKRAKDRVHDNDTERNRLQTQNGKRSKIWFIDDIQPENFSDGIGKILKEYNENPLNTLKKEKRQILDRLHKKGIKQGYIFFGGYSHNYGLSRVGDSYIYDVPAKKTGNLRKFRNQKIRVICVGSGTRFIRSYMAGPII